jgi:hypothetical protein
MNPCPKRVSPTRLVIPAAGRRDARCARRLAVESFTDTVDKDRTLKPLADR